MNNRNFERKNPISNNPFIVKCETILLKQSIAAAESATREQIGIVPLDNTRIAIPYLQDARRLTVIAIQDNWLSYDAIFEIVNLLDMAYRAVPTKAAMEAFAKAAVLKGMMPRMTIYQNIPHYAPVLIGGAK